MVFVSSWGFCLWFGGLHHVLTAVRTSVDTRVDEDDGDAVCFRHYLGLRVCFDIFMSSVIPVEGISNTSTRVCFKHTRVSH